ncbi:MAG: zinc-ribbon domain-containing protein [Deltaproteobacteria bacterium]|jgi:predicted Zn finger-like uncharacterized protein|nr:zinc-ribbon domain-containing protein [Deltaproteobacteria bacterium]MDL1988152.1 zinc-ribbon domain-containing protein [Deltaproteobacteria bacterium]
MIITCNECDTRFNIDESLLKQTGSKVRCSKCKKVFLAYPSSLSEEPDKSSEVETELEAVITDEEIESGMQYKAEEELEGIELATDEAFEENTKVEEKPEETGLELELDLEPEIDETQAEIETELELELYDKTDSEISAKEEPEGIEPEEIEIDKETETKIEESKQEDIDQDKTPGEYTAEKIEEKEEPSKTFNMGVMPDEQEAEKAIEPIDKAEKDALTEKSEPPKVAANKRISMPVLLLLLATLLISGAYVLHRVGINIPFFSLLKPEVQDAGNPKIYPSDINNKFVENSKIGKLLVITGKAKNGYSDARSYISITGKLYTKGKILLKTKTVYCGTILSELELLNMDLDAINNRLSNRFGDNKSNIKVKEGSIIPFMIVFADLPENLDEFTIEVAGSLPS